MGLPKQPVTLSVEQIEAAHRQLGELRHDINNNLSLIVAAAELIKLNPDLVKRMCVTLSEQPPKISDRLTEFAQNFERTLGITRE